jgi:hypothetical protein
MSELKVWIVRTRGIMSAKQTWRQELRLGGTTNRFASSIKEEVP